MKDLGKKASLAYSELVYQYCKENTKRRKNMEGGQTHVEETR